MLLGSVRVPLHQADILCQDIYAMLQGDLAMTLALLLDVQGEF